MPAADASLVIRFRDGRGTEWTVTRWPAGDFARLEFVSEVGERRAVTVVPLEDDAWSGVNANAWRAALELAGPA
jgi:hypothetical protein